MQDRTIQYSRVQYGTVQYSAVQHNTITRITQINIQFSRQISIRRKITRINQEHTLYTIKTQKLLELEVDETVLKTTRYTLKSE